jgi:hypothetical protein
VGPVLPLGKGPDTILMPDKHADREEEVSFIMEGLIKPSGSNMDGSKNPSSLFGGGDIGLPVGEGDMSNIEMMNYIDNPQGVTVFENEGGVPDSVPSRLREASAGIKVRSREMRGMRDRGRAVSTI